MDIRLLAISVTAIALSGRANCQDIKSPDPGSREGRLEQLSPFEFKNIRADRRVDDFHAIGFRGCIRGPNSQLDCVVSDPFAGGEAVETYSFVGGWFMSLTIHAARYRYEGIRSSLTEKYGPPCNIENSKWQNAMGASLDNELTTWCFSTGKLTLFQIGSELNETQAIYKDNHLLSDGHKPVVDF